MTDNQEHEEPPQCYTYVQMDGETVSVSKTTHSNVYDVVRYLVKKGNAQPIKWVRDPKSDYQKAMACIRKRKEREKKKKEDDASGEEPEHKKRKVPAKFTKALRSFMFTCPRVKETEGINARTQWLDVFKSTPNNTLSKALVVLEPHMSNEGTLDIWDDDTEEAKPPNHISHPRLCVVRRPHQFTQGGRASPCADARLHVAHQRFRHRPEGHV
jgi:hypothetical protein